jgi:acetyl-CoA acetyltransferase
MTDSRSRAAIVGIGCSRFGRGLPDSQLALAAVAFKAALADAGLTRDAVDGLSIHMGWPLGPDYDRVAEAFGLDIGYVNQSWLHGRFVTNCLQHAALAVINGLASVVACVTAISFTRERQILGGPGDVEGNREEGGTHGEAPPYGLTSPAGGAALAMQRYMATYGAHAEQLGAVAVAFRKHAAANPAAVMRRPITQEDHDKARPILDPLRLLDCCLITDGAVVALVTSEELARDLRQKPVLIAGMQGIRAGREEFIFGPRGLGINQQSVGAEPARTRDLAVYGSAGIGREAVQGFYTYDAFTPLVLFALERFGFCGPGEAADFVQEGRIELGGALPVNSSGGLLSEAHVGGWNSIAELVRQLRGDAGPRQIPGASCLQWGTVWGDSILFRN